MNDLDVLSSTPAIALEDLITIAEQAESRINAINKIKNIALRVTNQYDWIDQSGKPYLQVSGAEKIARLFGISWRIDEPFFEVEEGGHFSYTYKGYFSLGGVTIEAIGTRSSKDGFFKRYDKQRNELPPSEIDKGDVKKAAYTNCIGNGITRLLGIRNLTWEDIKQAGIVQSQTRRIEYKETEKPKKEESKEKDIRDKFLDELVQYCEKDLEEMEKICRQCSFFEKDDRTYTFGINDVKRKKENGDYRINEKWIGKALGVLRDLKEADNAGGKNL